MCSTARADAAAAKVTTLALPADATAVASASLGFSVLGTASDGHTTYLVSAIQPTATATTTPGAIASATPLPGAPTGASACLLFPASMRASHVSIFVQ